MSFELDSRGADDIDAQVVRDGIPFGTVAEPGFFTGSLIAPVKGLARGLLAKPNLVLGDALTVPLRPAAQALDKSMGTTLDSWLDDHQRKRIQLVDDLRPDPATTGFAGNLIGSLFDLGSSAALLTPEGAAILEGYARKQELAAKGVDQATATAVGAVTGITTLVGVKAPLTLGTSAVGQGGRVVAGNAAYGAGVSAATGVTERGASHELLQRNGYADQAALLDPYDKTALLADLLLGGMFSGGASAIAHRSTVRGQELADAARAVQTAKHAALETAPGVPVDTKSMAAHQRAMATAFDQVLAGERVNVGDALAETGFLRDTSAEAGARAAQMQGEMRLHVADILAAARAVEPEPTRAPPTTPMEAPNAPQGLAETVGRVVDAVLGRPEASPASRQPAEALGDPMVRAAAEVAQTRPDMRVVMEDGTPLTAREAVDRVHNERAMVKHDTAAFEAAINCLLRN